MQCLFATTYVSAEHAPKATNLPFGVTGSSPILTAAEKNISLSVTRRWRGQRRQPLAGCGAGVPAKSLILVARMTTGTSRPATGTAERQGYGLLHEVPPQPNPVPASPAVRPGS